MVLLQGSCSGDKFVHIGKLGVGVLPCSASDPVAVEEERRPESYVVKLPPLAPDPESSDGIAVVVGEEREVEVERLAPSDVTVGGVAGDGDGPDSDLL